MAEAGDGEQRRDELALLLETTARAVAAVLRAGEDARSTLSPLGALSALRTLAALVTEAEAAVVRLARREGRTWQEIADTLGVSRQAAHQRFAGGTDATPSACPPELLQRAVDVVEAVSEGRFEDARVHFDDRMRLGGTPERLREAWEQMVDLFGPYESHSEPEARAMSGLFLVDTPLRFERGPLLARTTLRADGGVAGFFLLLEDGG